MNHSVLLISQDAQLGERVQRALRSPSGNGSVLLRRHPHYLPPPPDAGAWLLVLLDAHAARRPAAPHPADARSLGDARLLDGCAAGPAAPPVIWLGDPPLLADPGRCAALALSVDDPGGWPIIDYLDRNDSSSKLAFVLRQHLRVGSLRKPAAAPPAPAAPPRDPVQLQLELNNALAGLLGNAELALDAPARLPTHLHKRLQSILELARLLRDLLPGLLPPSADPSRADRSHLLVPPSVADRLPNLPA